MVYTVTLNPALDYVMRLDSIDTSDINRAKSTELYYGGKGINVSVILSRLGIANKALGFVAGFTGDELERLLNKDKINSDFIKLPTGNTRINVKIFEKNQIDINAPSPDIDNESVQKLFEKINELKENDFLVLAGSVPSTLDSDMYKKILDTINGKGINTVVDTTGNSLLEVLPYHPFLIKPNHHELSEIFHTEIKSDDEENIVKYGKELKKMGAKNVLISRGKCGATLIDENDNVISESIVPGKTVNNVGCGDSMVGGFIAGYIETNDTSTALKLGSAAGNATAFAPGLASKEEIEIMKAQHFGN